MLSAKELLPPTIYAKYGDLGLRYMDSRIVACIKYLRTVLNRVINVNGTIQGRTIRVPGDKDYSQFSDHSWGRAIDFDVPGMDSLAVQKLITKDIIHSTELKKLGLTAIEDGTVGWTHISCADFTGWNIHQINGIYLIPIPKK